MEFKNAYLVFTDGACSGNPGPGGWGCVIASPGGSIVELGGGLEPTTNNQMELRATIEAVRFVSKKPLDVYLYTDSTYVIRGMTQWIWGWKKRDWKNAEGDAIANIQFWEELDRLVQSLKPARVHWRYSRGHIGTPGNERCDEIAVSFSKHKKPELYEGPLLKYSVAIYDVPENHDLPPPRPITEKKQAYSYLSVVSGVIERHSTWSECESRVKGRSGAKFKKTTSAENEEQLAAEWGFTKKDLGEN